MSKQVEPVGSPWVAAGKGELADRLGIGRNAPAAWLKEGAPAELCELQWRVWAAANGKVVKDPTDRALIEKLATAGLPHYRQLLAAAAPGAAAAPAKPMTLAPGASLEEQKRFAGWLDLQERLTEHEKKRRALVLQADVVAAFGAVGRVLDRELRALPGAESEAATRLRATLQTTLEAELLKLTEPPA